MHPHSSSIFCISFLVFFFTLGISFSRLQQESQMSRSNSGSVAPSPLITTASSKSRASQVNSLQPGHHLVLGPTVVLTNLLPCEMNYYLKVGYNLDELIMMEGMMVL